jgi:hypothetical protein
MQRAQCHALSDASGTLHAHALSDVWVEVSHPSAASLPALLRVRSQFHTQPLVSFPPDSSSTTAAFPISGNAL